MKKLLTRIDQVLGRAQAREGNRLTLIAKGLAFFGSIFLMACSLASESLHEVVFTVLCGAGYILVLIGIPIIICVYPYLFLSLPLCLAGNFSLFFWYKTLLGWILAAPALGLGLLCAVRYLTWRDRLTREPTLQRSELDKW